MELNWIDGQEGRAKQVERKASTEVRSRAEATKRRSPIEIRSLGSAGIITPGTLARSTVSGRLPVLPRSSRVHRDENIARDFIIDRREGMSPELLRRVPPTLFFLSATFSLLPFSPLLDPCIGAFFRSVLITGEGSPGISTTGKRPRPRIPWNPRPINVVVCFRVIHAPRRLGILSLEWSNFQAT